PSSSHRAELREELTTTTADHDSSRMQASHDPGPSSGSTDLPCNKQREAKLRHGRAQLFDELPPITNRDNSSSGRPRIRTTPSSG
ncbi:hypothetical protein Dimus_004186, partial [Dionaea muscipula]